jgi:hypothetical protein
MHAHPFVTPRTGADGFAAVRERLATPGRQKRVARNSAGLFEVLSVNDLPVAQGLQ